MNPVLNRLKITELQLWRILGGAEFALDKRLTANQENAYRIFQPLRIGGKIRTTRKLLPPDTW